MKKQIITLAALATLAIPTVTSFANESISEKVELNSTAIIEPKQDNGTITASNVALRKTPGTSGVVVSRLQKGQAVFLYSDPTVSKDGYKWQKVGLPNGLNGWVATNYIKIDG